MENQYDSADIGGWSRPTPLAQLDLFPESCDRILAIAHVDVDEVERWRSRGWISFDVRSVESLSQGRVSELCFIRDLARSGLSDVQIDCFLEELERPYLYDPTRTAYSFKYGWVQIPLLPTEDERDAYIEHHLFAWIQRKTLSGERDLLRRISDASLAACMQAADAVEHEDVELE